MVEDEKRGRVGGLKMRRKRAVDAQGLGVDKDKNQQGGGGVEGRRKMRARWEYRAAAKRGKQRQNTEEKRSKKRGNNERMKGRSLPVV